MIAEVGEVLNPAYFPLLACRPGWESYSVGSVWCITVRCRYRQQGEVGVRCIFNVCAKRRRGFESSVGNVARYGRRGEVKGVNILLNGRAKEKKSGLSVH